MKTNLLLSMACIAAFTCASASAQNAPLRGVGLLALGANEIHANTLVDMADAGGGSIGSRALRGSDGADRARPATARPAAATPKRPTYRWQSLVPGAIK